MKPLHPHRFLLVTVLLSLPLLALDCSKQDENAPYIDPLPAATTSGADTWGCLVYGETWKNTGAAHIRGDWTSPDTLTVAMDFAKQDGNQQRVYRVTFSFADTTNRYTLEPGTYILPKGGGLNSAEVQLPTKAYPTDKIVSGVVHLSRLDRQARIVSGTFELTMAGGPGDTISLSGGRFDGHLVL